MRLNGTHLIILCTVVRITSGIVFERSVVGFFFIIV